MQWDYRCDINPDLSSVWLGSMETLVRWWADSLPLLLYSGFQLFHRGFPTLGGQCAVYIHMWSHALSECLTKYLSTLQPSQVDTKFDFSYNTALVNMPGAIPWVQFA